MSDVYQTYTTQIGVDKSDFVRPIYELCNILKNLHKIMHPNKSYLT